MIIKTIQYLYLKLLVLLKILLIKIFIFQRRILQIKIKFNKKMKVNQFKYCQIVYVKIIQTCQFIVIKVKQKLYLEMSQNKFIDIVYKCKKWPIISFYLQIHCLNIKILLNNPFRILFLLITSIILLHLIRINPYFFLRYQKFKLY